MSNKFVYPNYKGVSLLNIPSTVLSLFGIPAPKITLKPEFYQNVMGVEKIILLLIDGLGWNLFNKEALKYQFFDRLIKKGKLSQITSVFPASTTPAINTLNSGLSTQEHGLPEWYVYLEELDCIVESLPFAPVLAKDQNKILDQTREILLNQKTIYESLKEYEIPSFIFCPGGYSDSFYNKQANKGGNIIGYNNLADLLFLLKQKLKEIHGRAYFYVYWPDIDGAEHHFGPWSEEAVVEIAYLSEGLEREFVGKIDPGIASKIGLLVTADHGLAEIDKGKVIYLDEINGLTIDFKISSNGNTLLPTGLPRNVYLNIKEKKLAATQQLLKQRLKGKAEVIKTKEAIKIGLFGDGPIHSQFLNRVGNLMILPYDNKAVWYRYDSKDVDLVGQHGGLSADEMLIPFISARLSDL